MKKMITLTGRLIYSGYHDSERLTLVLDLCKKKPEYIIRGYLASISIEETLLKKEARLTIGDFNLPYGLGYGDVVEVRLEY